MINLSHTYPLKTGPLERSRDFLLKEGVIQSKRDNSSENARDDQLIELPFFDFSTIVMATNNFSDENKVGQGGFGCVYKVIKLTLNNIILQLLFDI